MESIVGSATRTEPSSALAVRWSAQLLEQCPPRWLKFGGPQPGWMEVDFAPEPLLGHWSAMLGPHILGGRTAWKWRSNLSRSYFCVIEHSSHNTFNGCIVFRRVATPQVSVSLCGTFKLTPTFCHWGQHCHEILNRYIIMIIHDCLLKIKSTKL